MNKHQKHWGEKDTKKCQILTLDEFISKNNISNVDFIKLDVDGYEYVIKVVLIFKNKKPPIFMELTYL